MAAGADGAGAPAPDEQAAGAAGAGLPGLPPRLRRRLRRAFGEPLTVERLGGQSGAGVYRVRFGAGDPASAATAVVKWTRSGREPFFYRRWAAVVAAAGVAAPRLIGAARAPGGGYWLALEDVPHALPRRRWHADDEVLETLARLHAVPPDAVPPPAGAPRGYRPRWTARLTASALAWYPRAQGERLVPPLLAHMAAAPALFRPECVLSGDPNPTNWGLRADGSLVLFDWERFTRGRPALDLAITVPGLGDRAAFDRVAAGYLRARARAGRPLTCPARVLAREIHTAKVWSVVEFLSAAVRGASQPHALGPLLEAFPDWVASP